MTKPQKERRAQPNDEFFEKLAEKTADSKESLWSEGQYEGQLAIDVYQTEKDIVIRAAIAGVKADDIDISVNNDMVTIKGMRHIDDEIDSSQYLYQECYWGGFSRSIILPVEVRAERVQASLKNGILHVILPKQDRPKAAPIRVVDEDETDEN